MRQIGRKLKSEQGASIVLALLFMLVCLMVGVSVLMAAASNGGRTRSNRQEQQAYFALSSALRMVADDLTSVEYRGQFTYQKEEITDPEGNTIGTTITYTQQEGKYECQLAKMFLGNFDALFAENMKEYVDRENASGGAGSNPTTYTWIPRTGVTNDPRTLTITPDSSQEQLKDFKVEIVAEIQPTYNMELTARLTGFPEEYGTNAVDKYKDYVLQAELTPKESSPTIDETLIPSEGSSPVPNISSTPMSWELKWIIRPEEEEI